MPRAWCIFLSMHIYTHPEFLNHEVAEGHAERPERLSHLLAHLQREGILTTARYVSPTTLATHKFSPPIALSI